MKQYRVKTLTKKHSHGTRIVHNFYPGPPDDPGRDRSYANGGFRYWITDEPSEGEQRCYCGWLDGRERYGTVGFVNSEGEIVRRGHLKTDDAP
jgi:hypothetical protein